MHPTHWCRGHMHLSWVWHPRTWPSSSWEGMQRRNSWEQWRTGHLYFTRRNTVKRNLVGNKPYEGYKNYPTSMKKNSSVSSEFEDVGSHRLSNATTKTSLNVCPSNTHTDNLRSIVRKQTKSINVLHCQQPSQYFLKMSLWWNTMHCENELVKL